MHIFHNPVYIEDTDTLGIVYYANYLKFSERARYTFLKDLGVDHSDLVNQLGVGFVVRGCHVDFFSPTNFGDTIRIETWIDALTPLRVVLDQNFYDSKGHKLTFVRTDLVFINITTKKPQRMEKNTYNVFKKSFHEMRAKAYDTSDPSSLSPSTSGIAKP
jgi:acyl-CoA thioester hydrolase